jgi:hypothetical protein
MMQDPDIGFLLSAFACQVMVGSLIGAVILRAACSLFNKLSGAPAGGPSRGYTGVPTHYTTTDPEEIHGETVA